MHLFLFIFLIITNQCQSFFKNPPFQLSSITSRYNLTCASDFGATDSKTDCEYCVFEFTNNGTDSTISRDCIYITNTYRLVTQRCTGFTNASDVGYGVCSQLPFEYFDFDLLCICATDSCNENFTTCKQSVDSNPNVPVLPTPVPSLTAGSSAITCEDTPLGLLNSTYYCIRDSTPYINTTQCEEYVRNHTVLCMYLETYDGSDVTLVALPDEDYEYVLIEQIRLMQSMAVDSNVEQYYNETANSFYLQWEELPVSTDNNVTVVSDKCYCMSNDCNFNLTTCIQWKTIVNMANKDKYNVLLALFVALIMTTDFFSK